MRGSPLDDRGSSDVGTSAAAQAGADKLKLGSSELSDALEMVVSAFVDLGFGASAVHLAQRAANDNYHLKTIAEDFVRNAA